jgi:hypothetical protein
MERVIVTLPVLFSILATLTGGSKSTIEFAREYKKPSLHLHPGISDPAGKLRTFLQENSVKVLNVAGPRGSKEPDVAGFVTSVLDGACLTNADER